MENINFEYDDIPNLIELYNDENIVNKLNENLYHVIENERNHYKYADYLFNIANKPYTDFEVIRKYHKAISNVFR